MKPPEKKIWFPAKRYGWGWGAPGCWQGWLVIALFYLFLAAAGLLLLPCHPELFVLFCMTLSVLLIAIIYHKGERPRWRWGKERN